MTQRLSSTSDKITTKMANLCNRLEECKRFRKFLKMDKFPPRRNRNLSANLRTQSKKLAFISHNLATKLDPSLDSLDFNILYLN